MIEFSDTFEQAGSFMKQIGLSLLTFLVVAATVSTAEAQRRPVRKPTPTPVRTSATLPPLEVRAARVKVENQYSNVGAFADKLGPIAQAIEALDAEAKTKRLSKQTLDKNAGDKLKVVAAIRGLREGLVKLESEFRVKPGLKRYLVNIQGISGLASESETLALGGKFVEANLPLRRVQQRLNDTLTAMPKAAL
jgi:hypothetical protein